MTTQDSDSWVQQVGDEDLNFIKRFILHSGSLKKLAAEYSISYPTVRLRLDRLIAKLEAIDESGGSPFEKAIRIKYAEGKIDHETLKELLKLHRKETKGNT